MAQMTFAGKAAAVLVLGIVSATQPGVVQAADEQSLEYQVKAAFLLNFTKFIEWPATAFSDEGSPISICILGDDPFGSGLDHIVEGETVTSRKVVIQRLRRPPPSKMCQVLFITKAEKGLSRILSGLGPGILTVGEGDDFLREGGMLAFVVENRHVKFDINQMAVENSGLKMSSRLLNVARSVKKES